MVSDGVPLRSILQLPGRGGGILSLHVALRQAGIEDGLRRSKCPPRGSPQPPPNTVRVFITEVEH